MTTAGDERHYRFGPLERRGLVAGWRGGQIASVATGLLVGVAVLHASPHVTGAAAALAVVALGVAFAFWPFSGRTGEEWLPTVVRWGAAGTRRGDGPADGAGGPPLPGRSGGRRHRSTSPSSRRRLSGAPSAGMRRPPGPRGRGRGRRPPPSGGPWDRLELLAVTPAGSPAAGAPVGIGPAAAGILVDRDARTHVAVLRVQGHSFALLSPAEKERRVGGWAGVLAALAREHSTVHRLQWIASTLPDDGRGVRAHLEGRAELGPDEPARRSYEEVLAVAGASASRHEVLVALAVHADRATRRAVRAAGGGAGGTAAVVLREAATLQRLLGEADMSVDGLLGPHELARVFRRATEPVPVEADGPASVAAVPAWPWPMATEARWGCLRTDAAWQATYWIAEWPRIDVGPDFLGPLLLGPERRAVSMVMEPLPPSVAVRQAEQARTADLADSELRRRGGFLPTARRAREAEQVSRREAELADGHASFRFSGYVTVTAGSRPALEQACQATEQAAGQARLELRRLYGDQDRAFACTLPLCRGLS